MFSTYRKLVLSLLRLINKSRGPNYQVYRNKYLLKPSHQQQLVQTGRRLIELRLAHSTTASISLRISKTQFVVTAQSSDLYRLTEQEFIINQINSKRTKSVDALPMSLHEKLYQFTPVEAVIFCQPPYTMVEIGRNNHPDCNLVPAIFETIGGISTTSPQQLLSYQMSPFVQKSHALIIPTHGVLVWGASLHDALHRVEDLEYSYYLSVISRN